MVKNEKQVGINLHANEPSLNINNHRNYASNYYEQTTTLVFNSSLAIFPENLKQSIN